MGGILPMGTPIRFRTLRTECDRLERGGTLHSRKSRPKFRSLPACAYHGTKGHHPWETRRLRRPSLRSAVTLEMASSSPFPRQNAALKRRWSKRLSGLVTLTSRPSASESRDQGARLSSITPWLPSQKNGCRAHARRPFSFRHAPLAAWQASFEQP